MRKIAIGLGVFLAIIIAAALIAPMVIPTGAYIGQVAAAVKQATGRDLKIAGPVSFHILPDIALTAGSVSLSNAPGGSAEFATIGSLDVGLKLMPLLSHKIEISHLTLDQPVIHLEVDKQGQNNWTFRPQTAPAPAAEKEAKKPGDVIAQLQQVSLGTIRIVNGNVTYVDARTGKKQEISKLDLTLDLPRIADKFSLTANADVNGKPVDIDITVANLRDLLTGTASAVTAKIDAPQITLSFKSDAAVTGKAVSFSKIALGMNALSITGTLGLEDSGKTPTITGALDLGAVDLNPYLPPAAATAGAPIAPAGNPAGWSQAPIDASALKAVNATLTLSLTSLKFHTIDIGKTDMALKLTDGRADIAFNQLTLYGGGGSGHIVLDGSGAGVGIDIDTALSHVAMQPLLTATIGVDRFSGTGGVTLALASHGRSQADLMAGLNGKGSMRIANGAIKGIDLVAIEHKPLKGLAEDSKTAETTFADLSGSFVATAGVLNNQDMQMQSPALGLTGKGTIDLFHRTLNYRVEPALPGGIQGGKTGIYGTAVPILIQGPWSSLSYTPDLSAVLQQQAQQQIGKQLDKLGGTSKAGSLLRGFLGH
jgi:AsmA protein